eukprot:763929-Hanusia_phi.AAC.6
MRKPNMHSAQSSSSPASPASPASPGSPTLVSSGAAALKLVEFHFPSSVSPPLSSHRMHEESSPGSSVGLSPKSTPKPHAIPRLHTKLASLSLSQDMICFGENRLPVTKTNDAAIASSRSDTHLSLLGDPLLRNNSARDSFAAGSIPPFKLKPSNVPLLRADTSMSSSFQARLSPVSRISVSPLFKNDLGGALKKSSLTFKQLLSVHDINAEDSKEDPLQVSHIKLPIRFFKQSEVGGSLRLQNADRMVQKSKIEQAEIDKQIRTSHHKFMEQYNVTACYADYIEAHNHFQKGGPAWQALAV